VTRADYVEGEMEDAVGISETIVACILFLGYDDFKRHIIDKN